METHIRREILGEVGDWEKRNNRRLTSTERHDAIQAHLLMRKFCREIERGVRAEAVAAHHLRQMQEYGEQIETVIKRLESDCNSN